MKLRIATRVCLLAALLLAVAAGPADAFSTDLRYGSVGTVTVPTVVGNNRLDTNISLTVPGGLVYASPAHRNISQRICIHHRLFAFIPASYITAAHWRQTGAVVNCYTLAQGSAAVRDGGALFNGLSPLRGYYTDFTVTWKDRAGGTLLGRIRINHSDPSDYACTAGSHCRAQNTYDGLADLVFDFY